METYACREITRNVGVIGNSFYPAVVDDDVVTGSLLLDTKFYVDKNNEKLKYTCCCGLRLCKEIGYCDQGMFYFPSYATRRQEWFDALNWKINAHDATNEFNSPGRRKYLAYWHFPRDHRTEGDQGEWYLTSRQLPWKG